MLVNGDLTDKKVILTIYEDQDGALLYSNEKNDYDNRSTSKVVSLHKQHIALKLTRKDNDIEICCHVFASKGRGRETGLYVVYSSTYSKNTFETFKICGGNGLNKIGFDFSNVEDSRDIYENNIIFKNISSFDTGKNHLKDFDFVCLKEVLGKDQRLTFSGGNMDTISSFIRILLENVSDFSFCISSKNCEICKINIQSNFDKPELNPIGKTGDIIEEIQSKKREEEKKSRKIILEKEAPVGFEKAVKQLQNLEWDNSKIIWYLYNKKCFSLNSQIDNFIFTLLNSEIQLRDPAFLDESEKIQIKENLTDEFIRLFQHLNSKKMISSKQIKDEFIKYRRHECEYISQNDSSHNIKTASLLGNISLKNLSFFKHLVNKTLPHLFENKNSPSSDKTRKKQNEHKMGGKAQEGMRTKYNSIFILLLFIAGIFVLIFIICLLMDVRPFSINYTNLLP